MLEIELSKEKFYIPENWSEVPVKRLPKLLESVFVAQATPETYHQILRLTLGISNTTWGRFCYHYFRKDLPENTRKQNAEILHNLLMMVSWMWTEEMTTRPFDTVKVGTEEWVLFEENLTSMSFGELSDAYIHLLAFTKQLIEGDERLHHLIATICRPRKEGDYTQDTHWNGDHRIPYNAHAVKEMSKKAALLPEGTKVAIMVYFAGSVKQLFEQYDLMETGVESVGEDDYPGQGLIKNQHLLAEKGIFGNLDQTKQANIHDVFLFLEEHRKDMKAQAENQKAE